MTDHTTLTTTQLLAEAKTTLASNGFTEVTLYRLQGIDSSNQCIFEDSYSLVAIVAFELWSNLIDEWHKAQTSFVELTSNHISEKEKKIWDCYLVLWTPDMAPMDQGDKKKTIRYDTGRVRKLIASGEDIREIADVKIALLPLLPIGENFCRSSEASVLDRIPDLLKSDELTKETIKLVIDAFEKQEPLFECIQSSGDAI